MSSSDVAIEMFKQDVPCTPNDNLFADQEGRVNDAKTPKLFLGAILADRFEITKYIESGAFGRGWVAIDTEQADRKVFLKTFRSVLDRPGSVDPKTHEMMVKKELETLMTASEHDIPVHVNIVSKNKVHYGSVTVPLTGQKGKMFFIVSPDLCEGGELYNYLVFGNGIKKFDEKLARYFFKQLVSGVAHMHEHGMFHRDLKLENIVLDSHYIAKIMDFGHAKHASECDTQINKAGDIEYITQTFVGTASYQPPELKSGTRYYDPAAFDIWSLGVILFFLVGIEGLAARGNDFTFISKVKSKVKNYDLLDQKRSDGEVPDNARFWEFFGSALTFSKELKHLLNGMFDMNVHKRFKVDRILQHPWLQGDMPSQEEVVKALSGRSAGIVERDVVFSLAETCASQKDALAKVEKTLKPIAPYKKHGHKLGICNPPRFAIAVGENRRVRLMWLTGGLAEWLEFRELLTHKLGVKL